MSQRHPPKDRSASSPSCRCVTKALKNVALRLNIWLVDSLSAYTYESATPPVAFLRVRPNGRVARINTLEDIVCTEFLRGRGHSLP